MKLKQQHKIALLHRKYIQTLKREKRWVRFYQAVIFILFFAVWELASRHSWIDPYLQFPVKSVEPFVPNSMTARSLRKPAIPC